MIDQAVMMTERISGSDIDKMAAKAMSEGELQANLEKLCFMRGLFYYHTHDSRRSPAGFPDTVILSTRLRVFILLAELKSEKGRLKPDQKIWGEALKIIERATPFVKYRVWRPRHWIDGTIFNDLLKGEETNGREKDRSS